MYLVIAELQSKSTRIDFCTLRCAVNPKLPNTILSPKYEAIRNIIAKTDNGLETAEAMYKPDLMRLTFLVNVNPSGPF